MKKKNFNQRTCCITNKKFNKYELTRICIINNTLLIDTNYKLQGRGFYLHSLSNFNDINIKVKLEKKMKIEIPLEFINQLREYLKTKGEINNG